MNLNYPGAFSIILLLAGFINISGQISGPERVIIKTNVSYTHSYADSAGTSFLWEADTLIFQNQDSIVTRWNSDGHYQVVLSRYDSATQQTRLLDLLDVNVVRPVIEYGYDAAGNRVSRQVVYYCDGEKKSKKIREQEKEELETSSKTLIYPNPAANVIYLKVDEEILSARKKQYAIYDNLGKMVSQALIFEPLTEIQVAGLQKGMYYLVITYDKGRKEWKIIKY